MNTTAAKEPDLDRTPRPASVSSLSMIWLSVGFGLCAGYLDVAILVFKKYCWNSEGYFRNASDFPWTVPLGHAFLMLAVSVVVVILHRRWPRWFSLRAAAWIFATLSIWMALLRMPLYGWCSLVLAAGLGRVLAGVVVTHGLFRPRGARMILGGIVGVLAVLAAGSSGWHAVREYRTIAGLATPPPDPRNVILIVWDTVRAYDLSLYGYRRDTTPHLNRWASRGVTYSLPVSPAPWTYPSHACFFTGQWPYRLDSQWKFHLDAPVPTLAEYLTKKGYQTAGFVANTNCCSYESGLNRGFAHFADYALTPRSILTRTVPGKWLLEQILGLGAFYDKKWATLQSRSGSEITDEFLSWLGRRRRDRPFFAFLNYFDAHEPYIPPSDFARTFGIAPDNRRDYQFLFDFVGINKNKTPTRDLLMARDCYDDCIASLDAQLDHLLETLRSQGLLEKTVVIITSDHGEAFGLHGFVGHSYSVSLEEVGVPLVILSPNAPAGRVVTEPVSLRDLPATVVDLLGVPGRSPFPGRSLANYWKSQDSEHPLAGLASPAFSERASQLAFQSQENNGREHDGLEMSVAALGYHYIRDGMGNEWLFDLGMDQFEGRNLVISDYGQSKVGVFRKMLLDILTAQPGSSEVEKAYLATYRNWLKELVEQQRTTRSVAASAPSSRSIGR